MLATQWAFHSSPVRTHCKNKTRSTASTGAHANASLGWPRCTLVSTALKPWLLCGYSDSSAAHQRLRQSTVAPRP